MFRPFIISLPTKLTVALLLISLLPLGILVSIHQRITRTILVEHASQKLLFAGEECANHIDTFLQTNLDMIQNESRSSVLVDYLALPPDRRANSPQEGLANKVLAELHSKNHAYISSYALLDIRGTIVLDTYAAEINQSRAGQGFFVQPMKTELPYVSPVLFSEATGKPSLYFSSPVRNSAGNILGVLRVRYDANILQNKITEKNNALGEHSFAVLLDAHYIRLAHGREPELRFTSVVPLDRTTIATLREEQRLPAYSGVETPTQAYAFEEGLTDVITESFTFTNLMTTENETYVFVFVRINTLPWSVVFVQTYAAFQAPIQQQTQTTLLLGAAIAASVAAAAMVMGKLLSEPIVRLTSTAEEIAAGNLTARARVESRGEIGRLATTFNSMAAQLHALVTGLEQQVSQRTNDLTLANQQLRQEISERKRIEEQLLKQQTELQRLATTDALTGLYNRGHFFALAKQLAANARSSGEKVSAIMLDIDFFKRINDTYGHSAGDQVLQIVAQRCRNQMRSTDIIGRYGGEEFAIILPQTDDAAAWDVAERLRIYVADTPIRIDRGMLSAVTVSVGVATASGSELQLDQLLDRADNALFAAKRAGRNQVSNDDQALDMLDEPVNSS